MLDIAKKIYSNLPFPVQSTLVNLMSLSPYTKESIWNETKTIDQCMLHDFKDTQDFRFFIDDQLGNLMQNAITSSFWKNKLSPFKRLNYDILEDIEPIDSDILRVHFDQIINSNVKGYYSSTGGSGRNPSKLYLSDECYFRDIAHVLWSWSQMGYKKGSRKLTLRGVNLGKQLFRRNPIYNELQINIFLMDDHNIDQILSEVRNFRPEFGHGYPSEFVRMGNIIKGKDLNLNLKGISFASESFSEEQRQFVERSFNCDVLGFYGHSERASFASETLSEKGLYQVLPTYGLIEVLKEDGKRATKGEFGEITCTGFINFGMPLIRYKTGDYATVIETKGDIVTKISDVKGRWGKDFLIDNSMNRISTSAINVHGQEQFSFKYIQLEQNEPGKVTLKCVPWSYHSGVDYERKAKKLVFEMGSKCTSIIFSPKVCSEKEIYYSHRGKVPYLVSYVKERKN